MPTRASATPVGQRTFQLMRDAVSAVTPDPDDLVSKSALKREHHGFKALGEELAALSERQFKRLKLDESLCDAIAEARRLKHGALQRQLRHLANLLVEHDPVAIRQKLTTLLEPVQEDARMLREVERWRDALLAGAADCLPDIAARCPGIDTQQVLRLAHDARAEKTAGRPPRCARLLFKYLRQARLASAASGPAAA
ncbi:MAG: DUF615 domain-containing protein [Gammaproteobacteria bacterium]|nr:DUF615 domain-containing protein [Gammaproteobacteria bacterium]